MVTDMTNGRTFSVLLKFSLPMLLSVAFQQLYNIVDSVIAGNFVSDMALGAIGASYPVTMIFMAVATGGSVGASVVVARLFGSKNYTYMKTAINTALVFVCGNRRSTYRDRLCLMFTDADIARHTG